MANFYGKNRDVDFAASKLMSFGKSFSRMNGQPLDESEVWYDKAALEAFAAGNSAYVGMKLVYVDETNEKVYQYSVQYDGTIKEIGVAPLGDSKSIVVDAETGTVSLKGIDSLVFERDILDENDEPTGEKEAIQYQPLMTAAGLIWVEPSKTTVEGLATLIEALATRVGNLETTVGNADSGLVKALADEIARAGKAEGDLDEAIKAIAADYVKANDIANFETKENVQAVADDLAEYIEANDDAVAKIKATADAAATKEYTDAELAKKANKADYDQTVLDLGALEDKVDAFLSGTGATDALDSLQELIEYINTHDDADINGILASIQALENKLAGVDSTVVAYVTAAIDALKIGDYAKAADLTALADRVLALEGKVDVDKVSTAIENAINGISDDIAANTEAIEVLNGDGEGSVNKKVADAKAEAIEDAKKYATREYVGEFTTGEDAYKDIKTIVAYINKKAEETLSAAQGGSSETAASVALALQNYKNENDPKVKANTDKLATIEEGAQVNVIESVAKANDDVKLVITKDGKTVKIDDSSLISLISAAQTKADQGVADAATAKAAADAAQSAANTNASEIATLGGRVSANEGKVNENAAAIAAHATEYATLKGRVDGHDNVLAEKANTADVFTKEQVKAITGTPEEGKTLVAMIAEKANAENVYTKSDVFTKTETAAEIKKVTGEVPADSTLMNEIAKAQAAATYDDTDVRGLISGNTTAIDNITKEGGAIDVAKKAALDAVDALAENVDTNAENIKKNADAIDVLNGDGAGSVAKIADDRIAAALAGADADFDTLKEMSDWLSEHADSAAAMNTAIGDNAAAIKVINETTIPAAIQTAKDYADQQITALDLANTYEEKGAGAKALEDAKKYTDDSLAGLPLATIVEIEGAKSANKGFILPEVNKFEMEDGKVTAISTDLLKNGSMTLILNGGTAKA